MKTRIGLIGILVLAGCGSVTSAADPQDDAGAGTGGATQEGDAGPGGGGGTAVDAGGAGGKVTDAGGSGGAAMVDAGTGGTILNGAGGRIVLGTGGAAAGGASGTGGAPQFPDGTTCVSNSDCQSNDCRLRSDGAQTCGGVAVAGSGGASGMADGTACQSHYSDPGWCAGGYCYEAPRDINYLCYSSPGFDPATSCVGQLCVPGEKDMTTMCGRVGSLVCVQAAGNLYPQFTYRFACRYDLPAAFICAAGEQCVGNGGGSSYCSSS